MLDIENAFGCIDPTAVAAVERPIRKPLDKASPGGGRTTRPRRRTRHKKKDLIRPCRRLAVGSASVFSIMGLRHSEAIENKMDAWCPVLMTSQSTYSLSSLDRVVWSVPRASIPETFPRPRTAKTVHDILEPEFTGATSERNSETLGVTQHWSTHSIGSLPNSRSNPIRRDTPGLTVR